MRLECRRCTAVSMASLVCIVVRKSVNSGNSALSAAAAIARFAEQNSATSWILKCMLHASVACALLLSALYVAGCVAVAVQAAGLRSTTSAPGLAEMWNTCFHCSNASMDEIIRKSTNAS